MTVRTKLMAIVATAGFAFVVLIAASAVIEQRIRQQLAEVEQLYVPKLALGPKLEQQLDQLTRSIQDATAAQDLDALTATKKQHAELTATLSSARKLVVGSELGALQAAIDDYYTSASAVARRLIEGELGEDLVDAMAGMQARQVRASQLLAKATALDQGVVGDAITSALRSQTTASQLRIAITFTCMLLVLALAVAVGRGILISLGELGQGLQRFGRGSFDEPIRITSKDELGLLAREANQMAESLKRLRDERDRDDWLKEGAAGFARELRGELEPGDVASRATRYLARYLEAPVVALYASEGDGALRLEGLYGAALTAADRVAQRFEPGEGLLGRAALETDITVVSDLPKDYLRVRSGLGDAAPHALVLVPLPHLGRVRGVLELAIFKPWQPLHAELLRAVQETLTIAMEVAAARASMRELLAETQRQATRLAAQEEELRGNNDELQAQQEELQAQQEELRQTNDELTAQSTALREQQSALEAKNAELIDARQRLEQKADELTTVSAYKSQFLANMSHELRTPLNSMLLLSNLLAQNEGRNLTDKQVEFCKTIHGAGKDLLSLINQVLDLAKIESGKQDSKNEPVTLKELAEYAERIFGPMARDKNLVFEVAVDEAAPATITSDKQRIEQILNNLLGNAIKFTQSGSVKLRIERPHPQTSFKRVSLDPKDAIALIVHDTGIGISADYQERVFAPFEQVDGRADRRYGGTGLGLSIARELATLLGGELRLHSAAGQGSTFTCYLPCDPQRSTPLPVAPSAAHAPDRAPSASNADDRAQLARNDAHLLVIEDDAGFALALGEVIHGQGLKYVIASDGKSGLQLAKERKPSGVILDVRLPDLDGFAVMEALRADPETSSIPVHFVSALEAGERGMALGAVGYLTKPVSQRDLVRMVESVAPKHAQRAYRVLIIEDDVPMGDSLLQRLQTDEIEARRVTSARAALKLLKIERFGCIVLDLSLPDMDGLDFLNTLREQCEGQTPPVIVHTGRPLSKAETLKLEAHAEAVVLKEGSGIERLLDEIRLFARRLREGLPPSRRAALPVHPVPLRIEGKKLLLVDDDMRTVYALSAVLRAKGAEVFVADNGQAALDELDKHSDVDLVLMDIMMPEMDGYEAIRRIRANPAFAKLPIIALTAKAMKGDREKCIEVGATDYLPKPVDPDGLARILHARLVAEPARGEGAHA